MASKNRIWEVDLLRGALLPGMIAIHLIYDIVDLYGFIHWPYPLWYDLFKNNYGAAFVVLSGLSATLGSGRIRRAVQVLLGGMACTAVTVGMYLLGMADRGVIIYFGVLHCLGVCMLLIRPLRRVRTPWLALLGIALVAAGWALRGAVFSFSFLMPLGFTFPGFASSDYYPLMPNFGYFLLGVCAGRLLYREKRSLLPRQDNALTRFFCFCGRNSLLIYLLHQPLLSLGCELYAILTKV